MSVVWRRSLVFVAVLGLGSFLTMQSQSSGQFGGKASKVAQWEYRAGASPTVSQDQANALGRDGWELVAIDRQNENVVRAVYKRPL